MVDYKREISVRLFLSFPSVFFSKFIFPLSHRLLLHVIILAACCLFLSLSVKRWGGNILEVSELVRRCQ